MEQHQCFRADFAGRLHTVAPARMAPATSRARQLLWCVLGVVDEDIGAFGQFSQCFVELLVSRLVVCSIGYGTGRCFDAESQTPLGMVQPFRRYLVFTDREGIAAGQFLEFASSAHGREVYREVRHSHLRFKDLFQAVATQKSGAEAVKVELIIFDIQGRKKWNSLNVVPVIMGHENVGLWGVRSARSSSAIAKHAQAGSAIENKLRAVWGNQLEAGRVSA